MYLLSTDILLQPEGSYTDHAFQSELHLQGPAVQSPEQGEKGHYGAHRDEAPTRGVQGGGQGGGGGQGLDQKELGIHLWSLWITAREAFRTGTSHAQ